MLSSRGATCLRFPFPQISDVSISLHTFLLCVWHALAAHPAYLRLPVLHPDVGSGRPARTPWTGPFGGDLRARSATPTSHSLAGGRGVQTWTADAQRAILGRMPNNQPTAPLGVLFPASSESPQAFGAIVTFPFLSSHSGRHGCNPGRRVQPLPVGPHHLSRGCLGPCGIKPCHSSIFFRATGVHVYVDTSSTSTYSTNPIYISLAHFREVHTSGPTTASVHVCTMTPPREL